jgi:hypothetical protein
MKNEAVGELGFSGEGAIGEVGARDGAALKDVLQHALCRAFEWVSAILMA